MSTLVYSELFDEDTRRRGFVAALGDHTVIVEVTGADVDTHEELLSAYLLAKETIREGR